MRIIQYFLIGLFLSLCTIPAFSACPPGMVRNGDYCFLGEQSYYLPDGSGNYIEFDVNNDPYGTWLKNNTTFDFLIPIGYSEVWYQYASYPDADRFNITAWTSDYSGFFYMTPLVDVEGVCTFCQSPLADSFFNQFLISGGAGGSVNTPSALFNIDGIKENIFATLLSIVGVLLMLLVFKYAWSKVKGLLNEDGFDYYERSVPIGNSGLTRDTLYSNDGTVQRISYSNQDRGLNENSEAIFNTGASRDWDNIQEPSANEQWAHAHEIMEQERSDWEARQRALSQAGITFDPNTGEMLTGPGIVTE